MLQEFLVTEDKEHTTEDTERVGMVIGREESVEYFTHRHWSEGKQ